MPVCYWFIFIWSQGLVPQTIHTKGLGGQVAGTLPTNSNQFELVGLVAGTKFGPVTRLFDKNGYFTRWDLSPPLVSGTFVIKPFLRARQDTT